MKDTKIKEYLKKDQNVSLKANRVFDNFIENLEIEKENSNNLNSNKKVATFYVFKKILTYAACFFIIIAGSNVYAHSKGYDNIFFLIKDLTTYKKVEDPNEIFFDQDIIISYSFFQITNNVEMQVNELQIKDNKARLFLLVKELKQNDETPFTYKVYNDNGTIMYDAKSISDGSKLVYTEILELYNYKDNTKKIKLEIFDNKNKLLKTVTIDLDEKTIEAKTENIEVKKISQIELNRFLKEETEKSYSKKDIEEKEVIILETYDIYYSDGKYTVRYLYMIPDKKAFDDNTVEDSDIYINSAQFKYENNIYKLVNIEVPSKFL